MIYKVIVDISNSEVDRVFDYRSNFPLSPGDRVLVPFGKRKIEGYVIDTAETPSGDFELKNVIEKLDDFTSVTEEMLALANYMKTMNLRHVDCLRLFMPSSLRKGKAKLFKRKYIKFNFDEFDFEKALASIQKNATSQHKIIERLVKTEIEQESDLNRMFASSTIKTLIEKNILIRVEEQEYRTPKCFDIEDKDIKLTQDQKDAINCIMGPKNAFLVHGVTGSGKTEIYMRVIEEVLKKGQNAIMLVPEISLTPQMLGVFRARFGDLVSLQHSGLTVGERYDEWYKLRVGFSKIALGPRSAIFAPLENVGAIIIDEEHDGSYVSDSNPRYQTIDIAKFRANYNNAKLILGSATPSVETYYSALEGQYEIITLDKRINQKSLPEIEMIDMKREMKAGNTSFFSAKLLTALEETLKEGEQAMIFLNRRGYSSFIRCSECGFTPKCPSCDVALYHHTEDNSLRCHYCGNKYKSISVCPICGNKHLREGRIGTQKVVKELERIFSDKKIIRMDLDSTSTKDSYVNILNMFNNGEADILVGTQMIAKGHDFKNVTLVGILDADISIYVQDFRANERTYQLITQVAGRAGRDVKPGRVLLQTYVPNYPVYGFIRNYDYESFYTNEIRRREGAKFPPFSTIVRLLVQSDDEQIADRANTKLASQIRKALESQVGIIRIQEMRAQMRKRADMYRFQVVVWIDRPASTQAVEKIYEVVNNFNEKKVTVFTEINPLQMS